MKKVLLVLLTLCFSTAAHSQGIGVNPPSFGGTEGSSISELFKAMPDSLLPYLTTNNRLDMLDFMEAKMKAEVTNLLDGKSEMTALTHDSLSIRMNGVLNIDMKVINVAEPVDSSTQVIRVVRTYRLNENQTERIVDVYSSVWRKLSSVVEQSSLLKRDDELLSKPHL